MRLLALLLLLTSIPAHGAPLEARFLRRMTAARDARSVVRLRTEYAELKISRAACRIQLAERIVPTACYLALNAEIRLDMHPSPADHRSLLAKLDGLCRRYAAESPVTDAAVSPACARWLKDARAIQQYRDGG